MSIWERGRHRGAQIEKVVSVVIFTVLPIDPNLTSTCIGIIILKSRIMQSPPSW